MDKRQLLYDLRHRIYCRIRASRLSGVGVFAIRTIPKGTDPFESSHAVRLIGITEKEFKTLSAPIKKIVKDFCFYKNRMYFLPDCGLNAIDIAHFINYSDTPNMRAAEGRDGDVYFIANRSIKTGEELTANYLA